MPSHIAPIERIWYAIAPDGAECKVTLQVGMPVEEPGGGWSVLVHLGELEERPFKIFGTDSWQAAALGMRFVAKRIEDFSELGWKFFWQQGGEAATPEHLGFDAQWI